MVRNSATATQPSTSTAPLGIGSTDGSEHFKAAQNCPIRGGLRGACGKDVTLTGDKFSSGSSQVPSVRNTPVQPLEYKCDKCGKTYRLKSSLAKHLKNCDTRDRTKCILCGIAFPTYAAVSQHECRVHENAYRSELAGKLPAPESNLMAKLASIEAKSKGGAINYREMERTIGLTVH